MDRNWSQWDIHVTVMYINRIAIGYPEYHGSQSDRNGLVKLAKIVRTQLVELVKDSQR